MNKASYIHQLPALTRSNVRIPSTPLRSSTTVYIAYQPLSFSYNLSLLLWQDLTPFLPRFFFLPPRENFVIGPRGDKRVAPFLTKEKFSPALRTSRIQKARRSSLGPSRPIIREDRDYSEFLSRKAESEGGEVDPRGSGKRNSRIFR